MGRNRPARSRTAMEFHDWTQWLPELLIWSVLLCYLVVLSTSRRRPGLRRITAGGWWTAFGLTLTAGGPFLPYRPIDILATVLGVAIVFFAPWLPGTTANGEEQDAA